MLLQILQKDIYKTIYHLKLVKPVLILVQTV